MPFNSFRQFSSYCYSIGINATNCNEKMWIRQFKIVVKKMSINFDLRASLCLFFLLPFRFQFGDEAIGRKQRLELHRHFRVGSMSLKMMKDLENLGNKVLSCTGTSSVKEHPLITASVLEIAVRNQTFYCLQGMWEGW